MVNRCIIVVGPYRSGTSVTAGVLHHLGVDMGVHLPAGDAWNPSGSFCDMALHFHLLELFHNAPGAMDRVKLEIDRRSQSPCWGIKDHKLFSTYPLVMPLLPCQFQLIVCKRPRAESYASFFARRGDGREGPGGAARLFAEIEEQVAQFIKDYPRPALIVEFSDLSHPRAFVEKIAAFVDVPVTQAALDIVQPEHVRFSPLNGVVMRA